MSLLFHFSVAVICNGAYDHETNDNYAKEDRTTFIVVCRWIWVVIGPLSRLFCPPFSLVEACTTIVMMMMVVMHFAISIVVA